MVVAVAAVVATGSNVSCAGRTARAPAAVPAEPVVIIAAERGPDGARLVAIDEAGDRRFVLLTPPDGTVRDTNPTVSPDRQWVVFASSRGRAVDQTSLWIARLGVEAAPVRLTDGPAVETHPTWAPDGRSIVFASTRDGGDFDLWRLPIERGAAAGPPVQLTSAPGHEITPTIAPDGAIAFTALTIINDQELESHLEVREPDGSIRRLTQGPADTSPAFAPDGRRIAFSRPQVHNGAVDADLWLLDIGTAQAVPIADVAKTDESGPAWSPDGRFVFATSLLRSSTGAALISSIVHVDLSERRRKVRILMDRAGAVSRLTPAVVAPTLDTSALRLGHEYLPTLARLVVRAAERQIERHVDRDSSRDTKRERRASPRTPANER
ncbi:MAG: hypothetical protein AB7O24_12005 [Kofleriaceae bacterium]